MPSLVRWYRKNKTRRRGKSTLPSNRPLNDRASWLAVDPFVGESRRPLRDELLSKSYQQAPIVDTCIPPIPEPPKPKLWVKVGRITGEYRLQTQPAFAVVELAGRQFKVTADDVIFPDRIHGVGVNDVVRLDRVLLLGSRVSTIVGRPYVPGACVYAAVEEHFRDGKVYHFKFKRTKRYRVFKGHRQNKTTLRILEVRGVEEAPGVPTVQQAEVPVQLLRGGVGPPPPRSILLPEHDGEPEIMSEAVPPEAVPAATLLAHAASHSRLQSLRPQLPSDTAAVAAALEPPSSLSAAAAVASAESGPTTATATP